MFLWFFNPLNAQYEIFSQYGNLDDCDTMSRGIYLIWWDNNSDFSDDADIMLDKMLGYRENCLNDLNMQDPPNPQNGYFYNVYIHNGNDIFPDWWGNGQGTDINGMPYLTLPVGAHTDWVNVAHETFHIFQYNANAPGFSYSGDSQWYIEASANWFAALENEGEDRAFVEAESLVRLPQVPLWLSFDNFPFYYPENWQRYVHQYALALLLYYLTEEADVPREAITEGMYSGTEMMPQEYYFNYLGDAVFRQHFLDWAAHMLNDFDFLLPNQVTTLLNEWDDYADPADDNKFTFTYLNNSENEWYRPQNSKVTRAWSFNTYRLLNEIDENYRFTLNADEFGSEGDLAFFDCKLMVFNEETGTSFYDFEMDNALQGSLSVPLTSADTEVYFIVASMPKIFEGVDQRFSYEIFVEKGVEIVNTNLESATPVKRNIVARYDVYGREINADYKGIQVVLYSDGAYEKIFVVN